MEVRHAHERHAAPAVGAHGAAELAADERGGLTRCQVARQDPALDHRLALCWGMPAGWLPTVLLLAAVILASV